MSFFLFVAIPPDRFLSNERMLVGMTSDVIDNSPLKGSQVYVNHNWYYWRKGFSPNAGRTGHILQAELSKALAGSVAIWDNHYSHRLGGDVDFIWFAQHPEWKPMFYLSDQEGLARLHVYQKMGEQEDYLGRLNALAVAQPYIASVPQLRAQWQWSVLHDTVAAERDVRTALSLQINDPQSHQLRGTLFLARHHADSALPHFSNAAKLSPKDPGPWAGMGEAYEQLAQLQLAREAYLRALQLAPRHLEANMGMFRLDSLMMDSTSVVQDTTAASTLLR
jgi:tetratricopeptide (TPR) repeat protein